MRSGTHSASQKRMRVQKCPPMQAGTLMVRHFESSVRVARLAMHAKRTCGLERTPSESPGPHCSVSRLCASAKNSVHVLPNETRFFCDARALPAALPLARLGVAAAAAEAAAGAVAEVTSTLAWGASVAPATPRRKHVRIVSAQPSPAECPARELGGVPSARVGWAAVQRCSRQQRTPCSAEYCLTAEGPWRLALEFASRDVFRRTGCIRREWDPRAYACKQVGYLVAEARLGRREGLPQTAHRCHKNYSFGNALIRLILRWCVEVQLARRCAALSESTYAWHSVLASHRIRSPSATVHIEPAD
jgi:hypothetical protein